MTEIWKQFRDYPYEISSLGRIKSMPRLIKSYGVRSFISREKILKPARDSFGYIRFSIPINGKLTTFKMHRALCEVFKGESTLEVNHIDGNKSNNRCENLEWITRSENIKHAFRIGLASPLRGELNPTSKITESMAIEIINLLQEGVGPIEISKRFNISKHITKDISRGKTWNYLKKQKNN